MSLSEEMPSKQPIFSSCEAAIRSKDQERATKEFLRKKKNQIDEVPPTCNKLGGIDLDGHRIREATKERRKADSIGYPAHIPRPESR